MEKAKERRHTKEIHQQFTLPLIFTSTGNNISGELDVAIYIALGRNKDEKRKRASEPSSEWWNESLVFLFGIISFVFIFMFEALLLLNRSGWVSRERWRGWWEANNWRSTECSKGKTIVWCVKWVIQSNLCECKDVSVMCWWKQNARRKRDAWIWLLRHWRKARHMWQWTVPVCAHSIIVVCVDCFVMNGHMWKQTNQWTRNKWNRCARL